MAQPESTSFYGVYPRDTELAVDPTWNMENPKFRKFMQDEFYWPIDRVDPITVHHLIRTLNANQTELDFSGERIIAIQGPLLVGIPVTTTAMVLMVMAKLTTTANCPGKVTNQSYQKHKIALVNLDGSLVAIPTHLPLMCFDATVVANGTKIVRSSQGNPNKWMFPTLTRDSTTDELTLAWTPIRNTLKLKLGVQTTSDIVERIRFTQKDWNSDCRPEKLLLYNNKSCLYQHVSKTPIVTDQEFTINVTLPPKPRSLPPSESLRIEKPRLEIQELPPRLEIEEVAFKPNEEKSISFGARQRDLSHQRVENRDDSPVRNASRHSAEVEDNNATEACDDQHQDVESVVIVCKNMVDQKIQEQYRQMEIRHRKLRVKFDQENDRMIARLEQQTADLLSSQKQELEAKFTRNYRQLRTELEEKILALTNQLEKQKADFEQQLEKTQHHPPSHIPSQPLTQEQKDSLLSLVFSQVELLQRGQTSLQTGLATLTSTQDKIAHLLAAKSNRSRHRKKKNLVSEDASLHNKC